jgi:hypothetical protein
MMGWAPTHMAEMSENFQTMENNQKEAAYIFLTGLENKLSQALPAANAMKTLMSEISVRGKSPSTIRENIFLYHILPIVSDHMQTVAGIGPDEARASLLCEYHEKVRDIASGNPFRRLGHPFQKKVGMRIEEIMQSWTKVPGKLPKNQAYPDLGFRKPFPYKIVFDAKYFTQNSQTAAIKALVEGAYETMFYRGLPKTSSGANGDSGWDYDYGCLVAYDASDSGVLASA